jgi:signal transduction histidine kinase
MGSAISGALRGGPRRRLLALALLLALSLSLGAGLALQAIQTSRHYRQTAERALEDYAGFAAFILASRTYRQLGGAVVETFTAWPASGVPAAAPHGTTCSNGNVMFERRPGSDALRTAGAPFAPEAQAFLRDTLRNAMPLLAEAGWRFRFIASPSATADGWFITSYRSPSGGYGLRGFTACLGGDASSFRQVMLTERALPPAVTGNLPADSMYAVRVASGRGRPLYVSPIAYRSPYQGTARLGTEFGDLLLRLDLRADLANRLVIGGIPSSPTPLALGLLGLSTLLVVTALLQLRREYELIGIRSDFISNVSHELRTPLSQILIFTELLKLGRLRSKAERDRSLDIIDQETRRLIRLVENVLQFSRSGAARRPLECERLALATPVHETVDAFRPLASARGATLRAEIPAHMSVRADRSALRQILLNLLDNAVKYGPRGQTVSIHAQSTDGHTRITVDDQGPGIPLEDRERVWQGYYRLQRESDSAVAGSGIGLAVVRSLATEMNGRTWVEDAVGGGARLVVELASGDGGAS